MYTSFVLITTNSLLSMILTREPTWWNLMKTNSLIYSRRFLQLYQLDPLTTIPLRELSVFIFSMWTYGKIYIIWWKSVVFVHSIIILHSPNSIVERGVTEYQNPRSEREFCQVGSMNILMHIGWRVVHSFSALTPKGNKNHTAPLDYCMLYTATNATYASDATETMSTMLMWKIRFIEHITCAIPIWGRWQCLSILACRWPDRQFSMFLWLFTYQAWGSPVLLSQQHGSMRHTPLTSMALNR